MNSQKLEGTITALVTPFKSNGTVHFDQLNALIEFNINNGVNGVLIMGTTGETPTIREKEYKEIIQTTVKTYGQRIPIIAGATSNATNKAKELIAICKECGASVVLSAGPYYNKPTQKGYLEHFSALGDVGLPIILYNVPSRTGGNIAPETVAELALHPNIIGIKEASGNLDQIQQIISKTNDDFIVLSGDDALTLPIIALGGKGVISVVSNIVPKKVSQMVREAIKGNLQNARNLHYQLLPLMKMCFLESNPIPVKTALSLMGKIENHFRLPMTPPSPETMEQIKATLKESQLIA